MDSSNYYKKKYKKYKRKYTYLKKQLNNNQVHNFYFIHSTTNFANLKDILKSGMIYPGKFLRPDQQKLSTNSEDVFANIYFEDINNLTHIQDFSILLHPNIIYHYGMFFNKGWQGGGKGDIRINATDSPIQVTHKLNEIREFLENPSLPEKIREFSPFLHHEVFFDHPISLDNGNLIGIMCNFCDENFEDYITGESHKEPFLTIKNIINDKSYKNVKIITRNHPVPNLNELIC
ncbi:putative transposase [Cotonvirus japonicus]|uniref:Transposase n=1 Tax=Cotonvirus japonicus TaxID=2811091 RepID=A0ABM7NUJ8_9VIRU|nr:putative transposase [Cotonvirus japonicus]BCS83776.1 putative transposase [Cotonvirus japonicus]